MENNTRSLLVSLSGAVGILWSTTAHPITLSLDHYRDAMGSTEKMHQKAFERIASLRKLLGTETLSFEPAKDPKGPFLKFEEGTDVGTKESIPALYKSFLQTEIESIRNQERREKPPVFDPSVGIGEQNAATYVLRKEFCDKNFTKKFEQLSNEISSLVSRPRPTVAAGKLARATGLNKERRALIAEYLIKNEPKGIPAIQDRIGKLTDVAFVDGNVSRLIFTPAAGAQLDRMPISLSALTTFRTNVDKYFIIVQGCYLSHLLDRKEDKKKGAESKELLDAVYPIAHDLYTGSLAVNSLLSRLTKGQLDFLLDLFIQLRTQEIPVEEEMSSEDLATWNPKKIASIVSYIESRIEKADKKSAQTMLADYQYYRLMHRQLYELEEYLSEEQRSLETRKKGPKQ